MTFGWDLPYPSQRSPLLARNIVAASQPLAAQAGLRMLLKGGNAVDAAVATAITLTVVEPTMNGIGGDAFALVWAEGKLHGLNASGRSPSAWSPARFAGHESMPTEGWDTVTVPGAVSGWVALSQRFGRLPFADLFEPAVEYAERGYLVSPVIAKQWFDATERLRSQPTFRDAFMPGGRAPGPGELFRFPDQGKTLSGIAQSKGEAFYRGEIAAKIAAASASQGGAMSAADLAAHRADWVEPIDVAYQGHHLHEIPPNGQGIAALMALGILREWGLANHPVDSVDSFHLQIEAMKLAFADVYRYVSDPVTMKLKSSDLLNPDYLRQRAHLIDPKRATDFGAGTLDEFRHRLSHCRGRRRHDGLLHSKQLYGLRVRGRRSGNRHQPAESRRVFYPAIRPSQSGRRRKASVPHHHSCFPDA